MKKVKKHDAKIVQTLQKVGIVHASKIAQSLQGSIWRACLKPIDDTSSRQVAQNVVIKVADRYLQQHSLANINGKAIKVEEDIVSEATLLRSLNQRADCPSSIVAFYEFFKSKTDYYLVMEDGGSSLFDFVVRAFAFLRAGQIEVSHWKQVVKMIFNQMLECIAYIHRHNIAHLDVSLENFLINDVMVKMSKGDKIEFVVQDIRVKICDFGLAKKFIGKCLCDKFCGKKGYRSPEVVEKKQKFDAKKNDIWCLGVCLFMMSTGNSPWEIASKSDDAFVCMTNGFMKGTLKSWDVLHFVSDDLLDLLESIFESEAHRISLQQIRAHPWWKKRSN
eukprot:CAMPEP_0197029502 /NCGR_PEP_ID=MMETSP1384-20130603/8936_1 /TAXON_ID=29189 /ORGANISM="Ammonia sp." /LENGTH=332 /DNA_ID=CAMNT_0042458679 /DNA_START=1 /DNA_END=999 /DNA_ORIENTATION=+